jgi:UDP-GlcNAc:undecaprenyl-phosphate/decaprenyl-phosphate GlcNAc-1-phosphate transferase
MTGTWLFLVGVTLFAFLATLLAIPKIRNHALRLGFVDYPGGRKQHPQPVPLLGGIAIMLPFFGVLLSMYCINAFGGDLFSRPKNVQIFSVLVGTAWMLILGTLDDKYGLRWNRKLLGQLAGVGILVSGGHCIEAASVPLLGPVKFGWWGIPLFAFVVIAITNAVNLIDGLDGFAGGVCLFASLTIGVIGLGKGDVFSAVVGFTLFGSLLAFLEYNFPPASIYMGDGGSLALGFLLSALASGSIAIAPGQRSGAMAVIVTPFLPFGIALLDVFLSVLRRWVSGRKIYLPDTEHVHHRLMASFRRPRLVVGILYLFTGMLSVISIMLALGPHLLLPVAILVAILVVSATTGLLKLYRIDHLTEVLANRSHFQFLDSFRSFMTKRIQRSKSIEDLISLVESGVRDLRFDSVELIRHERVMGQWTSECKEHPNSNRIIQIRRFQNDGVAIRWTMPTHDSATYQDCLNETWHHLLEDIEARYPVLSACSDDSLGHINRRHLIKRAG